MVGNARKSDTKFSVNWEGPCLIAEDVSKDVYCLEYLSGQPTLNTWNVTHLKFYFN